MLGDRATAAMAATGAAAASIGLGLATNLATRGAPDQAFVLAAATGGYALLSSLPHFRRRWLLRWRPSPTAEQAAVRRMFSSLLFKSESARSGPDFEMRLEITDPARNTLRETTFHSQELRSAKSSGALIAEAAGEARHVLIVGPRGAGKTTLIVGIAERMANRWLGAELPERSNEKVPLYIEVESWVRRARTSGPFVLQLSDAIARRHSIGRQLVTYWLRRDRATLLIDGLDSLEPPHRTDLLEHLNRWKIDHRGEVFMTCDSGIFHEVTTTVKFDTIASIQPLSGKEIRSFASVFADTQPSIRKALERFLTYLEDREEWRTPLVVSLLLEAAESTAAARKTDKTISLRIHPTPLRFGDELLAKGDVAGAQSAYKTVLETGPLEAPTALRLGLVLQLQGQDAEARKTFLDSVSIRLQESVAKAPLPLDLNDKEAAALQTLKVNPDLDLVQLSALSRVVLGELKTALSSLQDRGLIEVTTLPSGETRYRPFDDTFDSPHDERLVAQALDP